MAAVKPSRDSVLWLAFVVLTNMACATSAPISAPSPTAVPGTSAQVEESIDHIDFCFDRSERLHLVWTVTKQGKQSGQAMYQRFDVRSRTWAEASALGACEAGPIRIVDAPAGLHVIASRALRHWVSTDSGRSWRSKGDLAGDARAATTGFDAVANKSGLLVTYIASRRRASQPRSESEVVIGCATDSGPRSELTVFRGSHDRPSSPRVLAIGDSLFLIYVLSVDTDADTGPKSRILMLRSGDGGATWAGPSEVWPVGSPARFPFITSLDATTVDGRIVVFYRAGVVFALRATGPASWTSPIRVAVPSASPSTRSYQAYSPSCGSNGRAGRLAWIDTRFTRSEQTATKPLGGVPWSDQPEWANNDVFSLPLKPYAEMPDGSVPDPSAARHTLDMSRASTVKTVVHDDSAYVIWSGRARVGRSERDANEPPRLFYVAVPVE